jgi:NADH-quinone oxidoreductase subunit L
MPAAAWIVLFSPLVAVLVIAAAGDMISRRVAGAIAAASALVSFGASAAVFTILEGRSASERGELSRLYTWLSAGDLNIGFDIYVDQLAVFMMLIISGVGFLILTYAVGYMHGDPVERRYHAYKALFLFSMLLLVMAGNMVLLLAGWGMVGLSSYLLINFYHQKKSAVYAGKKAFLINAFGDSTFLLAIFLLIVSVGTVEIPAVLTAAEEQIDQGSAVAILIALGLLGGAAAKSAQIPLHTWLPDAMEGPTPVSALIHAATMVTAGVYLIARTAPIFELAGPVMMTAAILALVQTDIKRVIAYSTMSQIGYMFAAAGIGAFGASMFHLMSHAFFKALLFLAAGVIIHALSGEQDVRKMGGLAKELPWTWRAFLVGSLALAAIPPLDGFFSKDLILAHELADGGWLGPLLWVLGLIGAFLTALYAFRLLFIVFWGEPSEFVKQHLHRERFEGGLLMMVPIGLLVFLTIVAGFLDVPGGWTAVETYIDPVAESLQKPSATVEIISPIVALIFSVAGIALAWYLWGRRSEIPSRLHSQHSTLARLLEHKLYFDEAYDIVFVRPAQAVAVFLRDRVEAPLILASVGELGESVRSLGQRFSWLQSGLLRSYVLVLAVGLAVIIVVFISVR